MTTENEGAEGKAASNRPSRLPGRLLRPAASAPARRLIFHIGHHKTGTTTIQDALARGDLKATGRRTLDSARMGHNYLRQHFEAWATDGTTLPGSPRFLGLTRLSARLAQQDHDDAVFSGEAFEGIDPAIMARVLDHFFLPHVDEHRILCWVRPHAARILSSFAEQLKDGLFDDDPATFHARTLRNGRFRYAPQLAAWRKVFGEHFRARPMVRDVLAGGSILRDFATEAFGPEVEVTIREGGPANESPSFEDLVLLRHLQSRLDGWGRWQRQTFGWEMAHLLATHPRPGGATRPALHRELAEQVRADYLDDARALDRGIFAATPVFERELDRAVDEAPPQPQSLDPHDHFNPDELRAIEVMGDMAVALLSNDGRPWFDHLFDRRVNRVHGRPEGRPGAPSRADAPGPRKAKAAAPRPATARPPRRTIPARAASAGSAPGPVAPVAPVTLLTYHDVPVLPNRTLYSRDQLGDGGPVWPELRPELHHYRRGRPVEHSGGLSPDEVAKLMKRAKVLAGSCLWGGFATPHFGHLIADHMTRIVTARTERPGDPVLFTLTPGKTPADLPDWFGEVAGWYGLAHGDIRFVTAPLLARELRVAPQAEQIWGGPPDPAYLALLDALPSARALVPRPNDLLYVTRAGLLAKGRGGHAGEAWLVSLLRQAGIAVLDPGAAPLREQLALYSGARRIVFAEGSALHGRQLLGYRAQQITVLNRRPGWRTGEGLLINRCDGLDYGEVACNAAIPARPDGDEAPARAISFYDLPVLFDTFARLGINLRRHWDDSAYKAARDADIRAWLAGLPHGTTLGEPVREAFLAAGLDPLDRWMPRPDA